MADSLIETRGPLALQNNMTERSRLLGLAPAKPTAVLDTYWHFAAERQQIFFKRLGNVSPPWTDDPVLRKYRFTNVYRASDRVSQYLIKHVIYSGDQSAEEIFFRTILFKLFNRIETWEFLLSELGTLAWREYSFADYDSALTKAIGSGAPIYSAAYIMPSGGRRSTYSHKHTMHLKLLERMMHDQLPVRIANAPSMRNAFALIREYPTIGDFLAYQYVTDLNYSSLTDFSEMEFTVAGPGARDGIRKCFSDRGGLTDADVITMMSDRQEDLLRQLALPFRDLWGRPIQLIDAQNIFCEVSKYSRVAHPQVAGTTRRTRIKQKYSPRRTLDIPWYPPKWGLNHTIAQEYGVLTSTTAY